MWLNLAAKLVPGMIKTGMSIASNRRKVKELQSVAEMRHAEKMASGEIEWKQQQISAQKNDLKDELISQTIMDTQEDVEEIKETIDKIDERLYEIQKN